MIQRAQEVGVANGEKVCGSKVTTRPQQGRFEHARPSGTPGLQGRVANVRANDKENGSDTDNHRASGERPAGNSHRAVCGVVGWKTFPTG